MTITASSTRYRYEGNGATATFSYLNRVYAQTDLKVDLLTRSTSALVETLTLTTDYTVTIAANGQATVTITNATKIPSVTQDILVRLDLPLTQTTELPTGTPFPAKTVENSLDKLTSIAQALAEVDTRTLKFAAQSPITNAVIANPVADAALVFDGTTGAIKAGPTVTDIEDAATNAATATAAAASAAASAATIGGFDLSGTPAANDAILWDTGVSKFVRKTIAQLRSALSIPFTPASSASAAYLDFAEDTDNGTNRARVIAPAALAADADITLPASTGTLATLAGTETLTNKTITTTASALAGAGFNLPHGTAPTSPNNGDLWTTTSGLFARINGVTSGLVLARDTVKASTSGTTVNFTGIPSGVKRIQVAFDSVSTNGTSNFLLQIGDAGGLETSGYASNSARAGASGAPSTATNGYILTNIVAAANGYSGIITLVNITGNTWVESGDLGEFSTGYVYPSGGTKTLSAELDRLTITTVSGDTFDAGQINVFWEF